MEKTNFIWHKIKQIIGDTDFISFLESYQPNTLFICGGCIRSLFIDENSTIKDIDLFVNMPKDDFGNFMNKVKEWGDVDYGQYGSPRLYIKNKCFYIDIVPFFNFIVSSHPISSIDDLLANFDFTANAIALDVVTKCLNDSQNGIQDIHDKVLRAVRVDFPEKKVSKDIPLSAVSSFWFRLLHYQNKLNFALAPETKIWIINNRFRYVDLALFRKYFFDPQIDSGLLNEILNHE